MNVLVIGGGGREHALAWKLAQSQQVTKVFCAPGNAGIAQIAECKSIAPTDSEKLVAFAAERHIDLTLVGPEVALCAGIADSFRARGLPIFGPTRQAAQLEGSKVFSKRFLLKHGISTAAAEIFGDARRARRFIRERGAPVVIKADGLAAGKGVIVAQTVEEAEQAVIDIMEKHIFGGAGANVVIEECLHGEEVSVMAFVDGKTVKLLASAQDHKRALDDDHGANTGGMGAYSPTSDVDIETGGAIHEIFRRTLGGLQTEGVEYRGVLYAGLMMSDTGPKVLEFNCRFGDPEAQVVIPRMDFDLVEAALAVINGKLDKFELHWKPQVALCVVMAAGGYPGPYERGRVIEGLKEASELANVIVFHAGTKRTADGQTVTDGGRVLGVTALGDDVEDAVRGAYDAVKRIRFDGAHYRRDIAARALRMASARTTKEGT
jgi:phosphoribosylamine--glycine ligase